MGAYASGQVGGLLEKKRLSKGVGMMMLGDREEEVNELKTSLSDFTWYSDLI